VSHGYRDRGWVGVATAGVSKILKRCSQSTSEHNLLKFTFSILSSILLLVSAYFHVLFSLEHILVA
jgi:hypothetical protein